MFSNPSAEEMIARQEKQIQELEIRLNNLHKHVSKLYEEVGISPEQLNAALQRSDLFSPEEWEKAQSDKASIEERLKNERQDLVDPKRASKTRHQMSEHRRHWIFVK